MSKKGHKFYKKLAIVTATTQQVIMSVALVASGVWIIFEYEYFNNVKLSLELENYSLKKHSNNHKTLLTEFRFKNLGNRDVSLCLIGNECALKNKYCEIYKLNNEFKIEAINIPSISSLDVKNKKSARVRGGVSHKFSCIYKISESGWYMVRFYIDINYSKHDKSYFFTIEKKGWETSKFIYVE